MPSNVETKRIPRTIAGMHPVEYAALWGGLPSTSGFYNAGDYVNGRAIPNPAWGPRDWQRFGEVVRKQIQEVERAIRTPKGRERTGWNTLDVTRLGMLARWTDNMVRITLMVPAIRTADPALWGRYGVANSAGALGIWEDSGFDSIKEAREHANAESKRGRLGECWTIRYVKA